MTTLPNDTRQLRKDALFERAYEFGKLEGAGKTSRPDFGFDCFLGAADGLLYSGDDKKIPDDVKPYYEKHQAGVKGQLTYQCPADFNKDSFDAQVSKARQLVIAGGFPFFSMARDGGNSNVATAFVALVKARIAAMAATSKTSPQVYDKFCSVARAQIRKVRKQKLNEPLTKEEIDAAIMPKTSVPEELKLIRQVMGRLNKLAEEKICEESAEYLMAAAKVLAPRVAELEAEAKQAAVEAQLATLTDEQRAALLAKHA